ncbi:MAG: thioesterase [Leptospirales bacterium]|nr:thioesterase [Leptospirales bacterium]
MAQKFETDKLIRIQHCDPGGVVFTPQYFNLYVEVVEDWFATGLSFPFSRMVLDNRHGIPAMKIVAKFMKPSFMGDTLRYSLSVKRLRKTSVLINIKATCGAETRCAADFLFGFTALSQIGLTEWPPEMRKKMEDYQVRKSDESTGS